jgi:WD40 repeat protein
MSPYSLDAHRRPITGLAFDQDHIYSVSNDGHLMMWESRGCRLLQTKQVSAEGVLCIGGSYREPFAEVLDKKRLEKVTTLAGHSGSVLALAMADDRVFTASADGTVGVWSKDDWTSIALICTGQPIVQAIAVDASYIYVGGIDDIINVYSRSDLAHVVDLSGTGADIFSLAVDNHYLYSGSGEVWWGGPGSPRPSTFESAVRVWDKITWECIHTLHGHSDNVNALALDGTDLYSVSDDGTLRVYSTSDWTTTHTLGFESDALNGVVVDEDSIYMGSKTGKVIHVQKSALG